MATASSSKVEERFNAAVNVIRGLPKHGSYQPSNDLMLRFYSYFKQATLGPCTQQRPAFWDVVNKVKWDTYKALGNMPRERAMELYVEELKKIIETMSYTDNVAEFMGSITELNSVDLDDLEAVAPDAIKQVKSRPNSPFASRESSPIRTPDLNALACMDASTFNGVGRASSYREDDAYNGNSSAADYSDDEYIDTVEDDTILLHDPMLHSRFMRPTSIHRSDSAHNERPVSPSIHEATNGHHYPKHSTKANTYQPTQPNRCVPATYSASNVEPALNQLLRCVESMRVDLQQINNRINIVERSLGDVKQCQLAMQQQQQLALDPRHKPSKKMAGCGPQWWPFAGISPTWMAVLILWPLVARRLAAVLERRRRA